MANLNLSQFGEKLFVADADHTFIWDTVGAISKRVSRNSWLNSGTLTSDAPVTISQTWNAVGQTFKALVVNAAGTSDANSASGSLLLDLQLGGVSQVSVKKSGQTTIGFLGSASAPSFIIGTNCGFYQPTNTVLAFSSNSSDVLRIYSLGLVLGAKYLGFGATVSTEDTILLRDGAPNTLALRNGAAAQTFNVYGTWSSASVYERMFMRYNGTALAFQIGTEQVGATARPLQFSINGSKRLIFEATGVNDTQIYAAGNTARNILTLRSLDESGRYQFYINASGKSELYVGTGVLISEVGSSYFNGGNVGIGTTAPASALHISGALGSNITTYDSAAALKLTNTTGNSSWLLTSGVIGVVNASFSIRRDSVALPALTISGTDNVGIGTTSPTSKLHVVGDAVLTGQLLGSDYTVGTVATATQANISITNNHAGQTNSSVVISPKGTGAFILGPKPDGTAVGGNARGNYAVDHQLNRSAAAEVASGPNSCIGGGQRNVASGAYSVVAGGQVTVASGTNSFAGGGLGVTASGSNSFAGGGQTNTASGAHSVVTGGTNNTASESFSFVYGGRNASANRYALGAHSAGQFSQVGDAQKTTAVFRNKTTTNSAVELFLDGASARYTVTSGKIISMLINITGTKSDGSAVAHYVRQYSIKNIGGTTSQVYAAVTVGTDNAAGTSIAISADDTNDSLKIEVTGVASETWRWVASVDAVEVGHGT